VTLGLPRRLLVPVPSADLTNKTILTVDDDPSMRAVVRATLERHGCRHVLAAGSGARALEILATHPVDLVICDMQMEPMDGLAFLAQARADLPRTRFRAIMLTAGSPDHLQGVKDLHIDAWLFKPITGTRLIEAVGAVLGGRIEAVMPEAETDRVLAEIAARYRSKLDTDLALLGELATRFAQSSYDDRETVRHLRRLLHDMRGQAGTFGLDLVTALATTGDDLLGRAGEARAYGVSSHAELARAIQVIATAIAMVVKAGLTGDGGKTGTELVAKIDAFVAPLRVAMNVEPTPKLSNHPRGWG
jgi:CheY-like chemotaxis protein